MNKAMTSAVPSFRLKQGLNWTRAIVRRAGKVPRSGGRRGMPRRRKCSGGAACQPNGGRSSLGGMARLGAIGERAERP